MAAGTDRDPIALFREWWDEAHDAEPAEPAAAALATATPEGRPSVRMVLVRGADARGFVFYTNLESRKGGELAANPHAAIVLHWKSLGRQIRIEGPVALVSDDEADAYFASRARGSQIGAWASEQSAVIAGRQVLEEAEQRHRARFEGGEVPRPPFWGGFRLVPDRVEFWQGRQSRLHDRLRYTRTPDGWRIERLAP